MSEYHVPVLLQESVTALVTSESGFYVDATFGGGGHSSQILSMLSGTGKLMAFDRDKDAMGNKIEDERLILVHNNFRFVRNFVMHYALQNKFEDFTKFKADGILADLGVSSHQFDTPERGFSFRFDAGLDMRMNPESEISASDVINTYGESELTRIFKIYGEIEKPHKVASLIVKKREKEAIKSTSALNDAVKDILPKNAEHKFLAKLYQSLRIEVNKEMQSLECFLKGASKILKPGGRLVVITYHSIEDRMVKNFMKTGNVEGSVQKDFYGNVISPFKSLYKKPVIPSEEEISSNTRARSAKLRVAVKTEDKDYE